ncbi:MAG: serine protease [Verrucomicrobiales bacterium]
MKSFASLAALIALAACGGSRAEDLTTKDGRVFRDVIIKSSSEESIRIQHSGGLENIHKTLLLEDFAKRHDILIPVDLEVPENDGGEVLDEFKDKHKRFMTTDAESFFTKDVRNFDAIGLTVVTGSGVRRIPFEKLPDYIRRHFSYKREQANLLAQKENEAEKAWREIAANHADTANLLESVRINATLKVLQSSSDGHLCDAFRTVETTRTITERRTPGPLSGSKKPVTETRTITETGQRPMGSIMVKGLGEMSAGAQWNGMIYYVGKESYVTIDGQAKSGPVYYADQRGAAQAILRKKREIGETPETAGAEPGKPERAELPQEETSGTGFAIARDGYLATAYHLVKNSSHITVRIDGIDTRAQIVARSPKDDLALLKVDALLEPLALGDSEAINLGDEVFTIGFPNIGLQGTKQKLTRGDVNSLAGIQDDERFFQISVPVQPGNSGGPLVSESGEVVGVVLMRLRDETTVAITGAMPQNVNYAIKADHIADLASKVDGIKLAPAALEAGGESPFDRAQRSVYLIIADREAK